MISPQIGNPTGMTRRDGDSWGVADGAGPTALGVAMARAWEAESDCPLFTDPWARLLVGAAAGTGPEPAPEQRESITNYAAARTKWFDEYFLAASAAGVAQVVILGAGLDTRPWRLPWLSDSVVFEVDQPKVLALKTATMDASGAQLAAKYVPVPIDFQDDWPHALRSAGFDHNEPTAWAAEGLLSYMSAADQDRLFEHIAMYSARRSRFAVEASTDTGTDVAQWLCCHHWEVMSTDARDLLSRYHRAPASGDRSGALSVFVEAKLL